MLLTPIVIACSVGFLAVVYNYVERNKKAGGVKLVVVNNKQHEVGGKVDTTEDRVAWAIDLCRSEGSILCISCAYGNFVLNGYTFSSLC